MIGTVKTTRRCRRVFTVCPLAAVGKAFSHELDFKSTRSLRDTLLPTTGPPWLSSMSTT